MATVRRNYARTYTARVTEVYELDVPEEMLTDPKFFDADGTPTEEFDEWATMDSDILEEEIEQEEERQLVTELTGGDE